MANFNEIKSSQVLHIGHLTLTERNALALKLEQQNINGLTDSASECIDRAIKSYKDRACINLHINFKKPYITYASVAFYMTHECKEILDAKYFL